MPTTTTTATFAGTTYTLVRMPRNGNPRFGFAVAKDAQGRVVAVPAAIFRAEVAS
jgi:hypothetical protein